MASAASPSCYHSVGPDKIEGEIRNRPSSCKPFPGRTSDIMTHSHAIAGHSAAKSSGLAVRHTAVVGQEEDHAYWARDGEGEDDFLIEQCSLMIRLMTAAGDMVRSISKTAPTNSDSNSESGPGSMPDANPPTVHADQPSPRRNRGRNWFQETTIRRPSLISAPIPVPIPRFPRHLSKGGPRSLLEEREVELRPAASPGPDIWIRKVSQNSKPGDESGRRNRQVRRT